MSASMIRMPQCFAVCVLLFAPLWVTQVLADARTQLDAFSAGLQSLSGEFEQSTRASADSAVQVSSGRLAMKAPRLFRWDYQDPFEQQIVADGDNIWVYDIDLEQVSVRPQSFDESSSPLAILMDLSQLDIEFKVSEGGLREGMDWLELRPRSAEPQFSRAELGFSDNQLRAMRVLDNLDGSTVYRFTQWQRNARLAVDEFVFTPPADVDVVGERRGGAEITPVPD
jgi:outer membrane lipoprotein carrier protein